MTRAERKALWRWLMTSGYGVAGMVQVICVSVLIILIVSPEVEHRGTWLAVYFIGPHACVALYHVSAWVIKNANRSLLKVRKVEDR